MTDKGLRLVKSSSEPLFTLVIDTKKFSCKTVSTLRYFGEETDQHGKDN
jgi:hypothetical protein